MTMITFRRYQDKAIDDKREGKYMMKTLYGWLMMALILVVLTGCENRSTGNDDIHSVKDRYEAELMTIPGVVGVGIGQTDGKECMQVYVRQMTPELERAIPEEIEGYPVVVEATGPIVAPPGNSLQEQTGD
ncbi:MAG: hypothetical protein ACUBOA_10490 [Candidatus Loosdrechtia sp.]|uniref:hypothetical protein n=1 Tax=Candidatus Loosdrechtia sp. TaxID=3101272 RepID=UPI003A6B32E7|nr:MAG: hypothetical protein QY305_05920 [Candidatus Jettenia sp. AMX2]